MGTRGAGRLAEGLSGLPALWGQQGPAAGPKASGLLGPASVWVEGGERAFLLSLSPSSHIDLLYTNYVPGTAAGCLVGNEAVFPDPWVAEARLGGRS